MDLASINPIVEWVSVVKVYKNTSTKALDQVSFSVHEGEIVVLVGPNGSGKTTAMEMASGLRAPTTGEVRVLGKTVLPGKSRNYDLGVQIQDVGLPLRLRVREAVRAVSCLYRNPGPVELILSGLGLDAYLNKMVDSLSGGWQKRLDVALACIGCPKALILDEPTSGMDPVARSGLWEYLRQQRKQGTGILISTHDLAEAEAYADRLLVLYKGRLMLSGSVRDVLDKAGGEWRLRLVGVSSDLSVFSVENGVVFLPSGDSQVTLGSRDQISYLAKLVEHAHNQGQIICQDILYGPVRLEDVFSFVINGGEYYANFN